MSVTQHYLQSVIIHCHKTHNSTVLSVTLSWLSHSSTQNIIHIYFLQTATNAILSTVTKNLSHFRLLQSNTSKPICHSHFFTYLFVWQITKFQKIVCYITIIVAHFITVKNSLDSVLLFASLQCLSHKTVTKVCSCVISQLKIHADEKNIVEWFIILRNHIYFFI